MARPASAPRPGVQKQLPLKLPPDIEIDLHVFCELHYGASRTKVIAEALTMFIGHQRANDGVLEAEFVAAKAQFMQTYGADRAFRLLRGNVVTRKSRRLKAPTNKHLR
jgi:hypothetical protein